MDATTADLILIARTGAGATGLAVSSGRIAAIVEGTDAVDELMRTRRGPDTVVRDVDGVWHPLFVDTHNHLALAARNRLGVPLRDARTVADIVAGVRERAARTPVGEWVVTAADWHEQQVAEARLPTAAELDEATTAHPVLVLRGGHNGVGNSTALALAGITAGSGDVDGGHVERAHDGTPVGLLQDEALTPVLRLLPPASRAALVESIERTSLDYRDHGVGVVRDPAVSVDEWHAFRAARADGRLHVRTFSMIYSPVGAIEAAGTMDDYLDALEAQGVHGGDGDDMLRLWGLKLVLDGGVEAAALREQYADRPDFRGTVMMDVEALSDALAACVRRGWAVGTHANGDAAVDVFLDAVQRNVDRGIVHEPGRIVMEHAALIDAEQIARTVELGIHVTAQQALRDGLVGPFTAEWGADRVARMFPWRELVAHGASVSAGTDHPIGPLDPIAGVLGMTTRRTRLGVLGHEHAIDRATALELYTVAGARLLGHGLTGTLEVGAPADLAVYPIDLRTAGDEALAGVRPLLTVVGGRLRDA